MRYMNTSYTTTQQPEMDVTADKQHEFTHNTIQQSRSACITFTQQHLIKDA